MPPSKIYVPNWLSRQLLRHPRAMRTFLKFTNALRYGTPKERAQRRALSLYERACSGRSEDELAFW